ncbi:MAG: hypothetical protein L0H37_07600, partial [Nitrosospira sp.]|nr:hypothetical protein [Nitrosospira sp.]
PRHVFRYTLPRAHSPKSAFRGAGSEVSTNKIASQCSLIDDSYNLLTQPDMNFPSLLFIEHRQCYVCIISCPLVSGWRRLSSPVWM